MIPEVPSLSPAVTSCEEVAKKAPSKPKRKRRAKHAKAADAPLHNCFREAEICCEEARSAARLKRFDSAFGLFSTAQSLLENAMRTGGEWRAEARERLQIVSCEMAVYRELARSTSRPLRKARH